MNKEFIDSLKEQVIDEKSALEAYRLMMANRYNYSSSNYSESASSESSGNIQEIGYEEKEDDEYSL